jgi:hypothetical protein
MSTIDVKTLGDLIKTVGPSEEDRQKFSRTFLGTLLGQTIVLVGMAVVYVAALALLNNYAKEHLVSLHATLGAVWFWIVLTSPFVCILVFSLLPTLWQATRERRLKISVIGGGTEYKPGYFRLHPYSATDRELFKRLDGADTTVLNWLRTSRTTLLYLSGASGVGKSSILAASILPHLREDRWAVVETRLFGEPIERLRKAILDIEVLFSKKPGADTPIRELLVRAADICKKKFAAPLLLVIDQFEEFLILHKEEERLPFADLLSDLLKNPIDNLRLLIVFRSDYRPLIFKLDLPSLISGQNWQELSPYDRTDATAFLKNGGRELSPEALDAMFRGLDKIEDARGIYRPITLNMVGLVLERMGQTLEGDPSRLIQSYLSAALTSTESRDFAKPVLTCMITDAGTKEPRSETELAALTGFQAWQVRATLADLARQGLVRRLEGESPVWEIAHDFLARTIGQLIGRLKPTIAKRARPFIAPIVLLGWIALAALALPSWITMQIRASEAFLRDELNANSGRSGSGGVYLRFPGYTDDKALISAEKHLARLSGLREINLNRTRVTSLEPLKGLTNLKSLDLSSVAGVTSLEPLKGLTNLTSLDLRSATGVTSLEPLKGLTNLTSLDLRYATGVTSLEPLKGLTNLTSLYLRPAAGVTSLEPLKGLTNLTSLDLSSAAGVASLEPLKGLTNLTSLDLSSATGVTSLEPLKGLTDLTSLNLSYATGVTSLEPLKGLTNLTSLDLSSATGVTSLEPLKGLTNLTSLNLSYATGVTSLEPLKGLTNLTSLDLSYATGVTSLEPLKGLTNLTSLDLDSATGVTSLEPLKGLTNLTSLDLRSATGVTSLEPLKGKKIQIIGASDKLRATLK